MSDKYILLVEDDPNDEILTLHSLDESRIKDKVVVTRDGVEALEYLFSKGDYSGRALPRLPRFVLLDLKLPKLSGLEVLEELRSQERTKLLPVVMFTSSKEEKDLVKSYNLGVNSFVCKPVDFTEFSQAVKDLELYWMGLNECAPD